MSSRDLIVATLLLTQAATGQEDEGPAESGWLEGVSLEGSFKYDYSWGIDGGVDSSASARRHLLHLGLDFDLETIAGLDATRFYVDFQNQDGEDAAPLQQGATGGAGLEFILWDLAQTQHLRESSLLAGNIQAELNTLYRIRDRGVKQAPFIVLRGATMPAVLVEVGYLSNPEDSAMLTDPDVRQRIAESLFRGISAFREQYAVLAGAAPN